MICLPGVIVRGVQPHILLVAGLPVENSLWQLAKRRPGEGGDQQNGENERNFCVSHSDPIETPMYLGSQRLRAGVSSGSILTVRTGGPAVSFLP
jgi:hypothetical protein